MQSEHLQALWQYSQKLAEDYFQYHRLPNFEKLSPQAQRDSLPTFARKHITQFERKAIKFCGEKFYRRYTKHLSSFKPIDCTGLPPDSTLSLVYDGVNSLAKGLKDRATFVDEKWDNSIVAYSKIDRLVELLLKEDLDDLDERMGKLFSLDRYLLKIIALSKDVKILLNAANSP